MFLKKSKSRTEVFVLLPDKPEKLIMSPTNKEKERMNIKRNCVTKSLVNGVMERDILEKEIDTENNNNVLSGKFMLVKPTQKCNGTSFENGGFLDLMQMGKKYEKLKCHDLKHEITDSGYNDDSSDQSLTSSDGSCKSPIRLSPREKKSVRFEDEVESDSRSSVDGNVLPVSVRQTDFEHQRNNGTSVGRTSISRMNKSDVSPKESSEKLERRGILTKTLSQNPFNIKREVSFTIDNSFICHQCEKTFKYQSNLKSHVKTVHCGALLRWGSQANLRSIDDLLICDICSSVFKYSVNLRAHKAGHSRNKLNATI